MQEATLYISSIAIAYDNKNTRIPIRIFEDFLANSSRNLKEEIEDCISKEQNYICIVDDQLGDKTNCSKEIIDFICNIDKADEYGIYLLLTSKDKRQNERFDEKIHIEYVGKKGQKGDENNDAICNAYLKSNYSMLINKMKGKRLRAVEDSYKYALENRNIALYLADMAQQEGVTNFEIIESWLELRERYYWNNEQTGVKEEIKQIIELSALLGDDDGAKLESLELEDSQNIRTFEEYDYNVNMYYKPINAGDIFAFKENDSKIEYFVLVGQECDMSLRKKNGRYKRKNNQCILLPIEILPESYVPKFEQYNGYEKVVLGNFRIEKGKSVSIKIDCTKEYIIDDIILDMCSYQQDGKARIKWGNDLEFEKNYLVTYAMRERYKDIQKMMARYKEIKEDAKFALIKDELHFDEDKYLSVYNGIIQNEEVYFNVQRVCRLKRYTSLITKMYIEHKWRSGFETINLDNVEIVQVAVLINNKKIGDINAGIQLTNSRTKNRERIRLKWYVKREELNALLEKSEINLGLQTSMMGKCDSEYYIFDNKSKSFMDGIIYIKKCEGEFNHQLYFQIDKD